MSVQLKWQNKERKSHGTTSFAHGLPVKTAIACMRKTTVTVLGVFRFTNRLP
jgi:hypothetical protein